MKVTQDVISDLLQLVQSGQASADSRRLVEEFVRKTPVEPPPQLETEILRRTKRLIRLRSWLIGLGVFMLLLPMSSYHRTRTIDGKEVFRMEWLMMRDSPRLAIVSSGLGICCWIGFFALRRRLRTTAL